MEQAMGDKGIGVGERCERALRKRRLAVFGLTAIAGGIVGAVFAGTEKGGGTAWFLGTIPGPLALVFALIVALAGAASGILYVRSTDEVDIADNMQSAAMGALVLLAGYPVWFILWKGRLVPEPSHPILFLTVFSVTTIAYFIRRFR